MRILIAFVIAASGIAHTAHAQKDAALRSFNNENFRTAANQFKQVVAQEPSAENFFYLGTALARVGNYDSARVAYDLGIKADPKYGRNYAGMARTFLSQNNATKAQEYFGMAKSTVNANKDVGYYMWLADAYTNNANANPQEAINQLNRAKEINYKDAGIYMHLGDAFYKMQKGGDAVSNYETALQYNPNLALAHTRIGDVWTDARRFPEALAAYEKALAINAEFAPALKGLSELYYRTGQHDKAKPLWERYMKVGEMTDDVRYRDIYLSFLTKDYAGTQRAANALLQTDTSKLVMYRLLAYSDYETGNYERGMQTLNNFLRRQDSTKLIASDFEYLAKFYQKTGNDSLALLQFERAVALDTTRKELYGDIAQSYYAKREYRKAAQFYEKKVRTATKPSVEDYYRLGLSYYQDTAYAKADSAFMKVTELSSTWPVGHLWRGYANLGLDNPDKPTGLAIPHFEKTIETGQADTVKYKKELIRANEFIGNFHVLYERYDEAMTYYNRVLALDPDYAAVRESVRSIQEFKKKSK